MSKKAMMTMARRNPLARKNPLSSRTLWLVGLAVGGAALIGGVAYAATSNGGTSPTPTPGPTSAPNTLPSVLKNGERYSIVGTAPAGLSLGSYGTQTAMQSALDQLAPGEFKVASLSFATSGSVLTVTMVVDVIGPDYTVPALATSDVAAITSKGISFTVTDMGPTPSGAGVPDVLMAGPYNPVTQMQVGETYLVSLAPIAGQTLATTVQNLTTASAQSNAQYSVSQSWDVNQVPASWPSQDSNANEWRMVVTYTSGSGAQTPTGFNIFTTGGATA